MKPRYSTLVKALKELNDAVSFGVFNAMSAKDIKESPCHAKIMELSNRADAILRRVEEAARSKQSGASQNCLTASVLRGS